MGIKAYAINQPELAKVTPSTIEVVAGTSNHEFNVAYNCAALLAKDTDYFDTVYISLSDGNSEVLFNYIIVCDPPQLRGFDINFLVLFGLAVLCQIIAIKTP